MDHSYKSIGLHDDVVMTKLRSFFDKIAPTSISNFTVGYLGHSQNVQMTMEFSKASYVSSFNLQILLQKHKNIPFSFSISRQSNLFQINLNCDPNTMAQNGVQITEIVGIVDELKKLFPEVNEVDLLKKISPDLHEMYTVREASIARLEETSIRVTESYETFRRAAATELNEKESQLKQEFERRHAELDQEISIEKDQLRKQKSELDELKKAIDDRSNMHARREISQKLLTTLTERYRSFTLSQSTNKKRTLIHVLFGVFLIVLGGLIVFSMFTFEQKIEGYVKLSLSALGFAATILYYIRWNDSWFRKHAEEEFYMKRFELDIERASWLVEMVLEFVSEKGGSIPDELVKTLSTNLFSNRNFEKVTHPTEDVLNAFFKSLAGVSIGLPGGGSIDLDKKFGKELKKAIERNSED